MGTTNEGVPFADAQVGPLVRSQATSPTVPHAGDTLTEGQIDAKIARLQSVEHNLNQLIQRDLERDKKRAKEPIAVHVSPGTVAHIRFDGDAPTPESVRVLVKYLIVMEDALASGTEAEALAAADGPPAPSGDGTPNSSGRVLSGKGA